VLNVRANVCVCVCVLAGEWTCMDFFWNHCFCTNIVWDKICVFIGCLQLFAQYICVSGYYFVGWVKNVRRPVSEV